MEILYLPNIRDTLVVYTYNNGIYTHNTQYLYAGLTSLQITTPIAILVDAPDNFDIINYYNTE